jgi:hypothetical protein
MDLKLNLSVSEQDLRTFKAAGMRVTIAKPVGSSAPNVTWLVFDPFMQNTIEWTEEYGLYASTVSMQAGTVITKMSDTLPKDTESGKFYLFGNNQIPVFELNEANPPSPIGQGSFGVKNYMLGSDYPYLTFGLIQAAVINNKATVPTFVNAAVLPPQTNAIFTPITTVYVWLQNAYRTGTVITDVQSNVAIVVFGGSVTENSLKYDSTKGSFVVAPDGKADCIHLQSPARVY